MRTGAEIYAGPSQKNRRCYVQMWVYVGNYDGDGDSSYVVELPLDPAFFEDAQVKSCFDYNTYQVYEDDATDDMAG